MGKLLLKNSRGRGFGALHRLRIQPLQNYNHLLGTNHFDSVDIFRTVKGVNPFTTGNPFLGTKLLGFNIGRGSGALKGSTQAEYILGYGELGLSGEVQQPPNTQIQKYKNTETKKT